MNNSSDDLILVRWHSSLYTAIHGLLGIGITRGANTLKRRAKLPHILDLTGPELLRLLVEKNCAILSSWCPRCLTFLVRNDENPGNHTCPGCGELRFILDDMFWTRVSVRIIRSMRLDKMLLRTVKWEWESIRAGNSKLKSPPYPFPKPLSWLEDAWTKAEPPSNRPVETGLFYRLSFMIERLRDLGLTDTEILDLRDDHGFPDGPVKIGRKDYANIRGETLRGLSAIFRRCVGSPPDAAELWRIMRWVRQRRESLLFRICGARVKQTKGLEAWTNGRFNRAPRRPTEQDGFRFKMVSVLVRQEGFTKEEAINQFAVKHGLGDSTEDISRSLERVWQYESAIAKGLAGGMPEPEEFWKPGVLRDQLNGLMNTAKK